MGEDGTLDIDMKGWCDRANGRQGRADYRQKGEQNTSPEDHNRAAITGLARRRAADAWQTIERLMPAA